MSGCDAGRDRARAFPASHVPNLHGGYDPDLQGLQATRGGDRRSEGVGHGQDQRVAGFHQHRSEMDGVRCRRSRNRRRATTGRSL